jgi:hypothetical protein
MFALGLPPAIVVIVSVPDTPRAPPAPTAAIAVTASVIAMRFRKA